VGVAYGGLLEQLAPGATSGAASVVVAVLAAPVVEELLFRGLLLGGLRRTASPLVAVVWSSLLFAFVHPMPWWPLVFVLGVLCAGLRLRSGSLIAAVALHAAYGAVLVSFR
jgi:membrane protease YdiL (CAAX protease family)